MYITSVVGQTYFSRYEWGCWRVCVGECEELRILIYVDFMFWCLAEVYGSILFHSCWKYTKMLRNIVIVICQYNKTRQNL